MLQRGYGFDKRLKENIVPLKKGLDVMEKLKPMRFDYIKGEKNQLEFIAQEYCRKLFQLMKKKYPG